MLSTKDCTWLMGDLRSRSDTERLVQDASTLIHLACSTNPRTSDLNPIGDIQDNLLTTMQLLDTYVQANPKGHVIISSSANIYGRMEPNAPHTESQILNPKSSYGIHKLALEHYLRLFCETRGLRGTVFRFSNPYGTLLSTSRTQGLIGLAFAKLLENEPLLIIDSPASIRDFIHLEDIVRAFEMALHSPPNAGECRIFNVGSAIGHSISEALDLVEKTSNKRLQRQYLPSADLLPTGNILSFDKIKRSLGWRPTISLEEGMRKLWGQIRAS